MNRRAMIGSALAGAAGASAQNQHKEVHVIQGPGSPGEHMVWMETEGPGAAHATFGFVAASAVDGKVVADAPYSAEILNETTRVLADGTRIVNKHMSSVARDKSGRTRRENNFASIGPFQNSSVQPPRMVTITDPVAKEVYILNLNDKTARKTKMGEPAIFRTETRSGNKREVFEERIHVPVKERSSGGSPTPPGDVVIFSSGGVSGALGTRALLGSKNVRTEQLGKQTMEGISVEGTRTTHTIPAGEIGNDRPIQNVSERWYSSELQIVIFSKTNDPQVGETIYRVSNLKRTEPDPGLFKVPADFKVEQGPGPLMIRKRPGPEQI